MFVGCSEISISVIVKHVQHIAVIRDFVCLEGKKKLLGCGLPGGSVPRLTLCIVPSCNPVQYQRKLMMQT